MNQSLHDFQVPSHWFSDSFAADKVTELQSMYDHEFSTFELNVVQQMRRCPTSAGSDAITTPQSSTQVTFNGGPSGKLPPALYFHIRLSAQCGWWMDGFIYVDGRFRFFGRGAHTFWDPPNVRLPDPCDLDNKITTNGRLIYRVEPVYPKEAKKKHIEGVVELVIYVNTDGTAKSVRILHGDPLLIDAARDAAMQFRYTPFMNCGKAVEMGSVERLEFPPKSK